MKNKHKAKTAENTPRDVSSLLCRQLMDLLVDAARLGHHASGRGVLAVRTDTQSLAWTYKPVAECGEEFSEWAGLAPLLVDYDPSREVVIVLDYSGEFFRLPLALSGRQES